MLLQSTSNKGLVVWCLCLFLWSAGCAEKPQVLEGLESENRRLVGELEEAREELRQVRLQLKQKETEEQLREQQETEEPTDGEWIRELGNRDEKIDRLREELLEAKLEARRYKEAGELAVRELNSCVRTSKEKTAQGSR